MPPWLQERLTRIYSAPGYAVLGIVFLALSFAFSRRADDRFNQWNAAQNPLATVHTPYPSPFTLSRRGIAGCFWGGIYSVLQWLFFIAGLDFLLLQGSVTDWALNLIQQISISIPIFSSGFGIK